MRAYVRRKTPHRTVRMFALARECVPVQASSMCACVPVMDNYVYAKKTRVISELRFVVLVVVVVAVNAPANVFLFGLLFNFIYRFMFHVKPT